MFKIIRQYPYFNAGYISYFATNKNSRSKRNQKITMGGFFCNTSRSKNRELRRWHTLARLKVFHSTISNFSSKFPNTGLNWADSTIATYRRYLKQTYGKWLWCTWSWCTFSISWAYIRLKDWTADKYARVPSPWGSCRREESMYRRVNENRSWVQAPRRLPTSASVSKTVHSNVWSNPALVLYLAYPGSAWRNAKGTIEEDRL